MRYTFSNDKYIAAHGKAPRGLGWWFFKSGNIEVQVPCRKLTEAKREATETFRRAGLPSGSVIYIES